MGDRQTPYRPSSDRHPGGSAKADSFFRVDPDEASHRRLGLRPRDAAKALGISTSTLNRLARAGEIKCIRLDRITLYPMDALEAWLKAKLQGAETKGGTDEAR